MGDLANFISELFKGLDIRRRWLAITVISAFLILLVIGFEYLTGFF